MGFFHVPHVPSSTNPSSYMRSAWYATMGPWGPMILWWCKVSTAGCYLQMLDEPSIGRKRSLTQGTRDAFFVLVWQLKKQLWVLLVLVLILTVEHQYIQIQNIPNLILVGPHILPSGNLTQLLNMTIEIVDLPIKSMVIFHSFLYVYQRVTHA